MSHLKEANDYRAIRKRCMPLMELAKGKHESMQYPIYQTMVMQIADVLGVEVDDDDLEVYPQLTVEIIPDVSGFLTALDRFITPAETVRNGLLADIQSESETESGRCESAADVGGFADRDSDRGSGRGGAGPADSGRGDGRNISDGDHGRDRAEKDSGLPDRQGRVADKTRFDPSLATFPNVHYTEHNGSKVRPPELEFQGPRSRRNTDQGELR